MMLRQVVDWRAAFIAGIVGGAVFLLLNLVLVPAVFGGNAWIVIRYLASILMGESILPPPATFDATATVVALVLHFGLSLVFALILAVITHRWGLIAGIIVGALYGFALYFINMYTFTFFFEWFFVMNSWVFLLTHVIFGAVSGGVYEALEVERYIVVEEGA